MSEPTASVTVHVHETPAAIFDTLAKVQPVKTSPGGNRWTSITGDDGTAYHFFAAATALAEAV